MKSQTAEVKAVTEDRLHGVLRSEAQQLVLTYAKQGKTVTLDKAAKILAQAYHCF